MEGGRINGGGVREIAHEGIENRRADDRRGLREEGREGKEEEERRRVRGQVQAEITEMGEELLDWNGRGRGRYTGED